MPEPGPGDFQAASLGYRVNLLARLLAQLLGEAVADSGVTPGVFAQLLALYAADGQTPSELSRAVKIEMGTMTKTLRRMERDGLIDRRPDPHDRRSVRIHLTAHARALEADLKATVTAVNEQLTRNLDTDQLAVFTTTLDALVATAQDVIDDRTHRRVAPFPTSSAG